MPITKSFFNDRVLLQNPCALPSGNRVDEILFGASENGQDVFIDVSVACSECHTSFERAMQTREKQRLHITSQRLQAWLIVFMPFVVGSSGGFDPSAIQVWDIQDLHVKNFRGKDRRHTWPSRSY